VVLFFARVAWLVGSDVVAGHGLSRFGIHLGTALFWLVWFEILAILGTLSTRDGTKPVESLGVFPRVVWTFGLVVAAGALRTRGDMPDLVVKLGIWPAYVAWFMALFGLLYMEIERGVFRDRELLSHPPTSEAPLDVVRTIVAVVTLLFFVGLFMPTPIAM
jgi:hypothetical protein